MPRPPQHAPFAAKAQRLNRTGVGGELAGERLVARPASIGSGWAQPEKAKQDYHHVDSPSAREGKHCQLGGRKGGCQVGATPGYKVDAF